jgi:hypothetical protein
MEEGCRIGEGIYAEWSAQKELYANRRYGLAGVLRKIAPAGRLQHFSKYFRV